MKLLDAYIGRAVLFSTGVVMFVLLALFAFATFAGELDRVGQGNYDVWTAAEYSALLLPRLAYQLFPLVALLGSIIGLGMLASNSELVVMRAAGVSLKRMSWSVMRVGLVMLALMIVMGEFVAPKAELYAQSLRAQALSEKISFRSDQGLWVRDGNKVVHIRDLLSESEVVNVSIYEFNPDNSLNTVTKAHSAEINGDGWTLQRVSQSQVSVEGVTSVQYQSLAWDSLINQKLLSVVTVKPEFLSVVGLYGYIDYMQRNGLDAGLYQLALWRKVMSPLAAGVMIFLAIPFVFGSLRSVGIGQRIFVGTLLGIGFYLLDQTIGQMSLVYGVPAYLGVMVTPLLFLVLALVLVRRVR